MAFNPKRTSDVDRSVGAAISVARRARGLSQTDLGAAIGISFQQVQKYEAGVNRIGAARLKAIARALGVRVGQFFGEGAPQDAEACELLELFAGLKDPGARRKALARVRTLARAHELQGGMTA